MFLAVGIGCMALQACQPQVQVAAPEPIVIQLEISHEIRVRVEQEVDALVEAERAGVTTRGGGPEPEVMRGVLEGRLYEGRSGYIASRSELDSEDVQRVESVNSERRAQYTDIAERNGAPVEAVEAIAGARRSRPR